MIGDDTGRIWEGAGREKKSPASTQDWSEKGGCKGVWINAATFHKKDNDEIFAKLVRIFSLSPF